ncbi:cbb3-type cytochrome c oxidase subunit 3 [Sneathiella limimaris]|uniref:cbb3-type cytochrome c oxidase subunit 3 n=1 Tax=Sneathiella limimaris TaxID=1964213 RepID=UPI00146B3DC5|nr:cbb3-type cytochrome c oxidase subunit 3 [Sneathiella limimaris]
MDVTFQDASHFAQTYGLVYLFGLFLIVLVYALWPKNKDKFDKAAQIPLEEKE